MQSIPTFLLADILTNVEINGVFVPFNRAIDNVQRFCWPVFIHKEDPGFEMAYSGSSFLLRHRGRNFLLCTKHQLRFEGGEFDPSDVCLIIEEGGRHIAITPDASNRVKVDSYIDKTAEDILLIEYESKPGGRNIDNRFVAFDLDAVATLNSVAADHVKIIFAIGYPTKVADYQIEYDDEFKPTMSGMVNRWIKLYLERVESVGWDLETRIQMQIIDIENTNIGNPDGLSGAPVFFIWQDNERQHHLGFAGMITHGAEPGLFQLYPGDQIVQVIKQMLGDGIPSA